MAVSGFQRMGEGAGDKQGGRSTDLVDRDCPGEDQRELQSGKSQERFSAEQRDVDEWRGDADGQEERTGGTDLDAGGEHRLPVRLVRLERGRVDVPEEPLAADEKLEARVGKTARGSRSGDGIRKADAQL